MKEFKSSKTMNKWQEWLQEVTNNNKSILEVIHEHYPKYVELKDKEYGADILAAVKDDLGLLFVFAENDQIIKDHLITINPSIISLSNNVHFIELYYQFVLVDNNNNKNICFDNIFFILSKDSTLSEKQIMDAINKPAKHIYFD